MGIVNYNPFRTVKPVAFDNLFDDFFGRSLFDFNGEDYRFGTPSVNVIEKDDHFEIEVAAPGLKKSDFDVEIDNNRLIISAEKQEEKEAKEEGKFTRREFNYTSFKRSFALNDHIDAAKIEATYANGILKLNLAKKESAITQAPKSIDIK